MKGNRDRIGLLIVNTGKHIENIEEKEIKSESGCLSEEVLFDLLRSTQIHIDHDTKGDRLFIIIPMLPFNHLKEGCEISDVYPLTLKIKVGK